MTAKDPVPAPEEADLLMPWLATGRLGARDAARLGDDMERNPERARQYELVREELAETIRLNEDQGAPSGRAAAQLFRLIDAERAKATPARRPLAGLTGWFGGATAAFRPAPRAWLAVAAALVIVAQGGLLATLVLRDTGHPGAYQTASGPQMALGPGSYALVSFAPNATAAQIAGLLESSKASIVRGPSGGLFTIRLADQTLTPEEVERRLGKLRENAAVVLFAAATQP